MVTIQNGTRHGLRVASTLDLLKKSIYKATTSKVERFINELNSENGKIYLAVEKQNKIGILAVIETEENQFELKHYS